MREIDRIELAAELLVSAVRDINVFKNVTSKDVVTKCFNLADAFADELQRRADTTPPPDHNCG